METTLDSQSYQWILQEAEEFHTIYLLSIQIDKYENKAGKNQFQVKH